MDLEDCNSHLESDIKKIRESYKKLQDCNLELEMEHFNTLQDLAMLETQLQKYQFESKFYEECKAGTKDELKKLRRQNRYYEKIVECFKNEMVVMSEQLVHLQEILNLSNQSCREENSQLQAAVKELQNLSQNLQSELVSTEKKVLLENQRNQMKDAKIGELQMIIGQKDADLNFHDEAINEMKAKLENATFENHELQGTIVSLNSKIQQLQCCLKNEDVHRSCRNKRSRSDNRDDYYRKKQHIEFSDETVENLEKELERVKAKNKEKIRQLKRQNEELREKLEATNSKCADQMSCLKQEKKRMVEKECCIEQELSQSKQIIIELRQALIELNESLAGLELQDTSMMDEYFKSTPSEGDIYASCRCEIASYKRLTENLKDALAKTKKSLHETQAMNKTLNEDIKNKDSKMSEIQKRASRKEKESCKCVAELTEKLKQSQAEEKRLSEFIEKLKQDVQRKIEDKKELQRFNITCACNDMSTTQAEITSLKVEIKNMIQNQLALNNENDKLLRQVNVLQGNMVTLEDINRNLRQRLETIQNDNQSLQDQNKCLCRETELMSQTVRNLEMELADTRNCRDDLCAESRNVVNNVKAWLEEQKKINDKVKKKAQCYCTTIAKLKQENETLLMGRPLANSTAYKNRFERSYGAPCTPVDCSNVWCLGSQGTSSPRDSPASCTCSIEEWYSPNYRDDEETDEINEDQFLHTLESFTQEIRANNRRWKTKCQECVVSKDDK